MQAFSRLKYRPIELSNITPSRLNEWDAEMRSEGLKTNAIASYMRSIRSIHNRAINEGVIHPKINAFKVYKIRTEATPNRAISDNLLRKIVQFEPKISSEMYHARNLFLLSFYFIGMNMTDLLLITSSNISKGRLEYKRSKTHKLYSIKVLPEAEAILSCYFNTRYNNAKQSIFECITHNSPKPSSLRNYTCKLNKVLKRICRDLESSEFISTYSARYTWVRIARELNIPKDVISEALGHSYGNNVTGVYLDSLKPKLIDEANALIINFAWHLKWLILTTIILDIIIKTWFIANLENLVETIL